MSYRIEFQAECNEAGIVASNLGGTRFPIFLHAIAAARAEAGQWTKEGPAQIVVNIFDQCDRLAGRLRLAVPEAASANEEQED